MDEERSLSVEKTAHGLQPEVRLFRLRQFRIGFGAQEERADLSEIFCPLVGLFFFRGARLGPPARVLERFRPVQVDTIPGAHHRVVIVPSVQLHDAAGAADHIAARGDLRQQHPVGPHRGDDLGARIIGAEGAYLGFRPAHFRLVHGSPHGIDLHQPERSVRKDEAGVDLAAGSIDHGVIDGFHAITVAHVIDGAVAEAHRAIIEGAPVADVHGAAFHQDGPRLHRGGGRPLREQRRDRADTDDGSCCSHGCSPMVSQCHWSGSWRLALRTAAPACLAASIFATMRERSASAFMCWSRSRRRS